MRIIGLTGGIACGKSNVSSVLRSLGAWIIDGDEISRELSAPDGMALPKIRSAFGDEVFLPDGTLNRKALGSLVFSDRAARECLDSIMQPLIKERIINGITEAKKAGCPVCILDMPLLYEKGLDSLCDRVWCVSLPEHLQLSRLMERDGLSREEALSRMRSQMSASEKAARAEVVIDTSGPIDYTQSMIPPLYRQELLLDQTS